MKRRIENTMDWIEKADREQQTKGNGEKLREMRENTHTTSRKETDDKERQGKDRQAKG